MTRITSVILLISFVFISAYSAEKHEKNDGSRPGLQIESLRDLVRDIRKNGATVEVSEEHISLDGISSLLGVYNTYREEILSEFKTLSTIARVQIQISNHHNGWTIAPRNWGLRRPVARINLDGNYGEASLEAIKRQTTFVRETIKQKAWGMQIGETPTQDMSKESFKALLPKLGQIMRTARENGFQEVRLTVGDRASEIRHRDGTRVLFIGVSRNLNLVHAFLSNDFSQFKVEK